MSQFCGICHSTNIYTDSYLGINCCLSCGAHEVRGGWQPRLIEKATKGILPPTGEIIDNTVVVPKNEIRSDGTEASNYCVFGLVKRESDELSADIAA
jgi:hypothetical protein